MELAGTNQVPVPRGDINCLREKVNIPTTHKSAEILLEAEVFEDRGPRLNHVSESPLSRTPSRMISKCESQKQYGNRYGWSAMLPAL
jgi:hypothetical protein